MNNEHTHESNGPQDEAARMYDLLCRHVFGEATEAESAEVERALANSSELRAQKAELDATVALVQGAFTDSSSGAEAGGSDSLSDAQLGELQNAARESAAAGSDFELKPVARGPRRWYAQPMVQFAAAATVLLGVGAIFVMRSTELGGVDAIPLGDRFEEANVELAQGQKELEGLADRAVTPGLPLGAADEEGGLGYSSLSLAADSPSAPKSREFSAGAAIENAPKAALETMAVGLENVSSQLEQAGVRSQPGAPAPTGLSLVSAEVSSTKKLEGADAISPGGIQLLDELGYSGTSSDDFFLGRGLEDARSNAKKDKSRARAGRRPVLNDVAKPVREVPQAATIEFDMERWKRERTQASGMPWLKRGPNERPRDMFFRFWGDNPFVVTRNDGLSTFAADVDSASFTLARRMLRQGILPKRDQIRTEEFVNYAKPDLAPPKESTFALHSELSPSPFGGREDRWLLRVGVRAKDIAREERPPLALTFVVDTSGSMKTDNRLELVKHALRLLVGQLDGRDTLSIVGFSSSAKEVLAPTPATDSDTIETALFGLQPSGGTNAEAGLKLGYGLSLSGGVAPNAQKRVIFLSDGVANMGQTDQDRLVLEVSEYADQGVFLNTIGVGMSNHSDVFLEQLANKGQGVCDYVGDAADARRAIVERFVSGFVTVAKDLKIQVEFDESSVLRWRQLGYENRAVADRDFRNDAVDAGEVGAGHQVTCFYELELASGVSDVDAALAKVRLRWKPALDAESAAEASATLETENAFTYAGIVAPSFRAASPGFRLGALSAQFAEVLRQSYHSRGDSMTGVSKGFANLLTDAPSKDAAAMAEAFKLAKDLGLKAPPRAQPSGPDAAQEAAYYQSLIEELGGADPAEPEGEPQKKALPPESYESRIRELLDGDREKGQH